MTAVGKTYRALCRGECPVGVWRNSGDIFSTAAPKGKWMEEVRDDPAKAPDEAPDE